MKSRNRRKTRMERRQSECRMTKPEGHPKTNSKLKMRNVGASRSSVPTAKVQTFTKCLIGTAPAASGIFGVAVVAARNTLCVSARFMKKRAFHLKHWCYAFWRAASSKKGVAAREIQRHWQISYKSALFLMHRIRFAMRPDPEFAVPLKGIVESDETYVGGKPRPGTGPHKRGRGTKKIPVFAMLERDGNIRRRVVVNVTGKTLKSAVFEAVSPTARIITDEFASYRGLQRDFDGGHNVINHKHGEYARGDVHTNRQNQRSPCSSVALSGIFHAVSKKHLHRYVGEFDFRWNTRKMNDGQRVVEAIRNAEGKRLMYRKPANEMPLRGAD
jgi:hypothetical protein